MAALSEWLQIMLGEIARKREDLERAREEDSLRKTEKLIVPADSETAQLQRASQR